MSKIIIQACVISAIVSASVSTGTTLLVDRRWMSDSVSVMQLNRLEIVDANGRVRESIGMEKSGNHPVPSLKISDENGRVVIQMTTDQGGRGLLGFASDRWNEGAVTLGHLESGDDVVSRSSNEAVDKMNAGWGLSVRGKSYDFTRMGYLNSGKLLTPETAVEPSAIH